MDFDGLTVGLAGAIGGAVATVLDWLDRKRVDDKFGRLNAKINDMQSDIKVQKNETAAIEKAQDGLVRDIQAMNSKMDLMLLRVGELTGTVGKGKD